LGFAFDFLGPQLQVLHIVILKKYFHQTFCVFIISYGLALSEVKGYPQLLQFTKNEENEEG